MINSRAVLYLALATGPILIPACFPDSDKNEGPEQVRLAISVIPDDVQCVRVKAVGPGRTVIKEIDAEPGQPMQKSFHGLPLGTVVFSADAFFGSCEAVTGTTPPQWVSDEKPVSVILGRLATVTLTMVRNGRAKVGVDFTDEPLCSAPGTACLSDAECCSKDCTRNVCRSATDAGTGTAHD